MELMFSPNMLKIFEQCPRMFNFRYVEGINMPVNDDIFAFGKNIHALASYYLKKNNIDKMEKALSDSEFETWNYLKSCKYFSYDVIGAEYNLAFKQNKYFYGGRLDALVKEDNKYYILDYKTGSAPKNAKYDYQTIIYILAVKEFFKTDSIEFIYLDLRNRAETCIEYKPEIYSEYIKQLDEITHKIEVYEKSPRKENCKCEYSKICY